MTEKSSEGYVTLVIIQLNWNLTNRHVVDDFEFYDFEVKKLVNETESMVFVIVVKHYGNDWYPGLGVQ